MQTKKGGRKKMNLQEYTEIFIERFVNTVYNRTGWNIENDVYMEIKSNNQNVLADIFYENYCWGTIYYGDEESDFELITIAPIEIEEKFIDNNRGIFANYLSILGAFIDSAYFDELSVQVKVYLPE